LSCRAKPELFGTPASERLPPEARADMAFFRPAHSTRPALFPKASRSYIRKRFQRRTGALASARPEQGWKTLPDSNIGPPSMTTESGLALGPDPGGGRVPQNGSCSTMLKRGCGEGA